MDDNRKCGASIEFSASDYMKIEPVHFLSLRQFDRSAAPYLVRQSIGKAFCHRTRNIPIKLYQIVVRLDRIQSTKKSDEKNDHY